MKALLRIIVLLTALLPAIAAAQGQQVNIFSFADSSCNAWLKTSGNKLVRAQYEFWMRGFVSGHNFANQSRQVAVGNFPAGDMMYLYLDDYCRDNPNSSYITGAIHLVEQLREPTAPAKPAPTKKEPPKAAPTPAAAPVPATKK